MLEAFIAQHYLGAGDRYPEIVRLNYGHDMGNGLAFTNPALIEPGWQLFLPGDGTVDRRAAEDRVAVVQDGGLALGHAAGGVVQADP